MKKFLVLSMAVFSLISCRKDKPQNEVATPAVRTNYYATVNNKAWDATVFAARVEGGRIKISGTPEDGSLLEIDLNGTIVGNYRITDSTDNRINYITDSAEYNGKVSRMYNGAVKITKHDTIRGLISGTFEAVLKNNITGKLLTVEDGEFKDIPYGPLPKTFSGDTLFMGWLNGGSKKGLYYILRNDTTGELAYRKISASVGYVGGMFSCLSDSGYYLGFPQKGVGGYFNLANGAQKSLFVTDSFQSPVAIGDKFYYYKQLRGLYRLDPLSGNSTFFTKSDSGLNAALSTDGTLIYGLYDNNYFSAISASRDTVLEDRLPSGKYYGLKHIAGRSFYTVREETTGAVTRFKLMQYNCSSVPGTLTEIADLQQDNNLTRKSSFAYDRVKGVFYAVFTERSTGFTKISMVNTGTGQVKTFTMDGDVLGIEVRR
ncbi:MAG: DUF6252 family protein [Bacteroidota bacterium]